MYSITIPMDFRFTPPASARTSVFERLYKDSAVRSRNFALCQGGRMKAPATPRGRKIEDELLRKAAESEARKATLREQREKEQMQEMRSAPLINETSRMLAAAKKSDIIVKKRPCSPRKPTPSKAIPPSKFQTPPALVEVQTKDPETERPPLLTALEAKASLRLPTPKPLSLTADLRKKFAELLVPTDDEPVARLEPAPVVKVLAEKQTQSDPKLPLAAFCSPVSRNMLDALKSERSPTKRLFYMNSYDRNRYWSRLREEKISKQRVEKEGSEMQECTFRPVRQVTSRSNSFAAIPRSKSQPRASTYTQRYQQKREWRSRASSPQMRPQAVT